MTEPIDKHGYARCARCGVKQPVETALEKVTDSARIVFLCRDINFCTRAAGIGRGSLDMNSTDAGNTAKEN